MQASEPLPCARHPGTPCPGDLGSHQAGGCGGWAHGGQRLQIPGVLNPECLAKASARARIHSIVSSGTVGVPALKATAWS